MTALRRRSRHCPRPLAGSFGLALLLLLTWGGAASLAAAANVAATISVDVAKPGHAIPPQFFGLMTEEINHSYDGGLYAELIQNRTFQDPAPRERGGRGGDRERDRGMPIHWFVVGSGTARTDDSDPVNAALPISLRLELAGGEAGVANDGYWGIPVRPDTAYTATFYAKGAGGFAGPVTASIRTDDGDVTVAKAATEPATGAWKKYTVTLKTASDVSTTAKAKFVLSASGKGSVSFSYVSLFPPTYQNAPNGLRPDIMELLAEMKPKFIRLPGGNYVEGSRFADRFNWKQMIGPPDQRPGHMGCWSYRSSDGFGMPEFLLWCKQLGAEPVLAVFAGYTLNGDHFRAGSPEMAIYTQEALDEIEYITGPADSEWGKRRAADGFPEPFPLRYVEIGNEDWFDRSGSYDGRFTQIAKAIRERYPKLKLIATAPVKSFKPDLYDDHFYRSPRVLREMFNLYDPDPAKTLRFEGGGWNGRHADIKTFVGEWAAQEAKPTTNLNSALADAAFIMGMERNSDAVEMQCYAPLFANVNPADPAKGYPRGWQWEYNLIGYDALRSFGSPSYHAQVMLAQNKGDIVLPTTLDVPKTGAASDGAAHGGIGLGAWHTQVEYTNLSVTGSDGRTLLAADSIKDTSGWETTGGRWRVEDKTIRPSNPDAETWAITGDPKWSNYTIRVRARKLGGDEGFIVLFNAADGGNYQWWNVGGWGNTSSRAEAAVDGGREPYGPATPVQVETGRWYNLRLEVSGNRFRGFIDDKLVTEATYDPRPAATAVYATATRVEADGTVLVKVVNAGGAAVDATINLQGAGRIEPEGTAIVLTGDPKAVNTVDEPRKVAPKQETVSQLAPSFRRTFPANSFTILRLKASNR
jgi:alpha-L-arabinofuranosidase